MVRNLWLISFPSLPMTGQLLTQRLDSILSFIETSVKQGAAFASAQAPDVVHEILVWKLWQSVLLSLASFVCLIPVVLLWNAHRKKCIREDDEDWWAGFAFAHFGYVLIAASLVLATLATALTALQIVVAPKLYLIEYISSLLKQ